jgi:hypothetical protein
MIPAKKARHTLTGTHNSFGGRTFQPSTEKTAEPKDPKKPNTNKPKKKKKTPTTLKGIKPGGGGLTAETPRPKNQTHPNPKPPKNPGGQTKIAGLIGTRCSSAIFATTPTQKKPTNPPTLNNQETPVPRSCDFEISYFPRWVAAGGKGKRNGWQKGKGPFEYVKKKHNVRVNGVAGARACCQKRGHDGRGPLRCVRFLFPHTPSSERMPA